MSGDLGCITEAEVEYLIKCARAGTLHGLYQPPDFHGKRILSVPPVAMPPNALVKKRVSFGSPASRGAHYLQSIKNKIMNGNYYPEKFVPLLKELLTLPDGSKEVFANSFVEYITNGIGMNFIIAAMDKDARKAYSMFKLFAFSPKYYDRQQFFYAVIDTFVISSNKFIMFFDLFDGLIRDANQYAASELIKCLVEKILEKHANIHSEQENELLIQNLQHIFDQQNNSLLRCMLSCVQPNAMLQIVTITAALESTFLATPGAILNERALEIIKSNCAHLDVKILCDKLLQERLHKLDANVIAGRPLYTANICLKNHCFISDTFAMRAGANVRPLIGAAVYSTAGDLQAQNNINAIVNFVIPDGVVYKDDIKHTVLNAVGLVMANSWPGQFFIPLIGCGSNIAKLEIYEQFFRGIDINTLQPDEVATKLANIELFIASLIIKQAANAQASWCQEGLGKANLYFVDDSSSVAFAKALEYLKARNQLRDYSNLHIYKGNILEVNKDGALCNVIIGNPIHDNFRFTGAIAEGIGCAAAVEAEMLVNLKSYNQHTRLNLNEALHEYKQARIHGQCNPLLKYYRYRALGAYIKPAEELAEEKENTSSYTLAIV